jgi:hypothetical protein
MRNEDVKRTLAKLHVTFMLLGFMSITQILKIVITNNDKAEVYANNGNIYLYSEDHKYIDRLEQVEVRKM